MGVAICAKQLIARQHHEQRKRKPLTTEEIMQARDYWVRREQRNIPTTAVSPGWKLSHYEETKILKCVGRICGYDPSYLKNGVFAQKLIRAFGNRKHDGSHKGELVDTKADISCNICKAFSTRPLPCPVRTPLPTFYRD